MSSSPTTRLVNLPKKLPKNVSKIKLDDASLDVWVREALEGYVYMRDGKDYVNNGGRYDRALEKLTAAREHLLVASQNDDPKSTKSHKIDLARLELWIGIVNQENGSYDERDGGPQKRNLAAMEHYNAGIRSIRYVKEDAAVGVRMSLYNSLGVACQGGLDICLPPKKTAMVYYDTARRIYEGAHPELQKELAHIMKKVDANSGFRKGGGKLGRGGKFAGGNSST